MNKLIIGAALAMVALPAMAQTTVQPFGPGGAVFQTPGQPPTTVQRWGNTDIIQTPGQPPSTVLNWNTQQGDRR
jgi:hypothetical protein